MKIFGIEISAKRAGQALPEADTANNGLQSYAYSDEGTVYSNTGRMPIRSFSFDGEKTPGALGNPVNLVPDFMSLRIRAYEANLNNDVIKIITGKFFKWVVGEGLKLQAQPNENVLGYEGIEENFQDFRTNVEAYWKIFSDSTRCDYSGMINLHELEAQHYETKFLGGDVLTVCRVDEYYNITVQIIDGQHVRTPLFDNNFAKAAKAKGNFIFHGVEVDSTGKHVAYYVLKNDPGSFTGSYERIEAYGAKSGCLMAWMSYGTKHRIDHHRGVPQITAILEKVKKLDRYTEATVSGAEERAKVPYVIEHGVGSDGENPMADDLKRRLNGNKTPVGETSYQIGDALAKKIAATEEKTVINMPVDSKLKALDSDSEINYDPLWQAIFIQLAASAEVPPEVALQKYNSNYSASRAAIMGWGYLVNIIRKKEGDSFKQNVYNLWLYIHILKNKVSASGYLAAKSSGNRDVVESYSAARWTGAIMPHIDPLKETKAIREMLGDPAKGITPLMSRQQAAEQMGVGEWEENFKEYLKEEEMIPEPAEPDSDGKNDDPAKKETIEP